MGNSYYGKIILKKLYFITMGVLTVPSLEVKVFTSLRKATDGK